MVGFILGAWPDDLLQLGLEEVLDGLSLRCDIDPLLDPGVAYHDAVSSSRRWATEHGRKQHIVLLAIHHHMAIMADRERTSISDDQ
jgi:hypothetical protein